MKLNLVVMTAGKRKGRTLPIRSKEFTIGHGRECQLKVASPILDARHCVLSVRGEQVFVRELNTRNGTYVNETRIKGEVELHNDDRLRVGFMIFRVNIEAEPVSQPAPVVLEEVIPEAALKDLTPAPVEETHEADPWPGLLPVAAEEALEVVPAGEPELFYFEEVTTAESSGEAVPHLVGTESDAEEKSPGKPEVEFEEVATSAPAPAPAPAEEEPGFFFPAPHAPSEPAPAEEESNPFDFNFGD